MRKKLVITFLVIMLLMNFCCVSNCVAKGNVKLNTKKITLLVGESRKLSVRNTKKKVQWKSLNKKVATVNKRGKVKGIKNGKTTVIALLSRKKLSCKIVVKARKNRKKMFRINL